MFLSPFNLGGHLLVLQIKGRGLFTGQLLLLITPLSKFRKEIAVNKTRRLRWADHVARMEEVKRPFKILTGKPTGKIPLRGARRTWEENIKIGPQRNLYQYEELGRFDSK